MIRYDATLVNLTSNFLGLCTNVKVYLYIYSKLVQLSMNIHEGKVIHAFLSGQILESEGLS